jgi:hypothetical protein
LLVCECVGGEFQIGESLLKSRVMKPASSGSFYKGSRRWMMDDARLEKLLKVQQASHKQPSPGTSSPRQALSYRRVHICSRD